MNMFDRALTANPGNRRGRSLIAVCGAALLLSVSPVAAAAGTQVVSVKVLGVDTHPESEDAAKRLLHRLQQGAQEACGGSAFSLGEVKVAVRRSQCWRDSVADAVARIDNPRLSRAYRAEASR